MAFKRTASKHHVWLSQVEVTGVVLSEPVLADAAPGGFPLLDKKVLAQFYKAREIWNLPKGMVEGDGQAQWIRYILEEILRLKRPSDWQVGAAIPPASVASLPEQQETLRPSRVLVDGGAPILFLLEVPREQSLNKVWLQKRGRWKASPTTKLERLLRETGVELGLVTNGEAWRLLVASPSETASWMTWTAQTWADSPITLAAFRDLLGEERFFAGDRDKVVIELIRQSRQRQLDVADQLGAQVREALDLLVHELDRIDAGLKGRYLSGYTEDEIFEAVVAFVMRLLFTLYAEENGLLPHGTVAYDTAYGALHLLTELESQQRLDPERLRYSYAAYARLLASARLIHAGSVDPDIRIAAHGGQLFNPEHSPLLEGRAKDGSWPSETPEPPRVSDAVVRQILRSLKYAKADGARQLVSYRELAVEQIGHMYEGLLDRQVARAPRDDVLFLLRGSSKVPEPEPLAASELEELGDEEERLTLIVKRTGRTKKTLQTILEKSEERAYLPEAGTDDAALLEKAEPVRRLIVPRGIVRPRGLYVTAGQDRRSQGAHYTPPSLTEPIVRRTLEHQVYENVPDKPGLLVEPRRVKAPEEILDLKVCDPAMGSGAFLVQAIRYLSERLVDAWELRAADDPDAVLTLPYARLSEAGVEEALLPETREERLLAARRLIAERCIFGVDRNRYAVEMAKLSLWIATLSADRPFTFLDHALKHGDSLVGLSAEQIRRFTWRPQSSQLGPLFEDLGEATSEARQHRDLIHDLPDHDYRAKRKELSEADEAIAEARLAGDLIIAAFFSEAKDKDRDTAVSMARNRFETAAGEPAALAKLEKEVRALRRQTLPLVPFHWEIEFPEVFEHENPGFDAFVGNPPFAGKNTVAAANVSGYPHWLKNLHEGSHGNADLIAHFFRRVFNLLREGGAIGLIATNTIAQGDTRGTGLRWICQHGGEIFAVKKRVKWPGRAAVVVSVLHVIKGTFQAAKRLDDQEVETITAFLFHRGSHDDPARLTANAGKSFIGSYVLGMGFTFDDTDTKGVATPLAEMRRLITENPSNAEVIFPYIGGEEVNTSPAHAHHRYVINFGERSEEQCRHRWPDLMALIEEKVKPKRMTDNRESYRRYWWQYAEKRIDLGAAIEGLERVLVIARVSNAFAFTFLPNGVVCNEKVVVFPITGYAGFCTLQARVHEAWGRFFNSSLKDDMQYTPSDCFDTFPFSKSWETHPVLEVAGKAYYEFRADLMVKNDEGLTKTYNRFHDPEERDPGIMRLRELHVAMDRAELDTYGWSDIPTGCEFLLEYEIDEEEWSPRRRKPWRYRWPDEVRDEVLARLMELNHRNREEEIAQDLRSKQAALAE